MTIAYLRAIENAQRELEKVYEEAEKNGWTEELELLEAQILSEISMLQNAV